MNVAGVVVAILIAPQSGKRNPRLAVTGIGGYRDCLNLFDGAVGPRATFATWISRPLWRSAPASCTPSRSTRRAGCSGRWRGRAAHHGGAGEPDLVNPLGAPVGLDADGRIVSPPLAVLLDDLAVHDDARLHRPNRTSRRFKRCIVFSAAGGVEPGSNPTSADQLRNLCCANPAGSQRAMLSHHGGASRMRAIVRLPTGSTLRVSNSSEPNGTTRQARGANSRGLALSRTRTGVLGEPV